MRFRPKRDPDSYEETAYEAGKSGCLVHYMHRDQTPVQRVPLLRLEEHQVANPGVGQSNLFEADYAVDT